MYDIKKRKKFRTVGELMGIMQGLPDETQILITGDDYCWFHIEKDGSVVCLDCEDLDECYDEQDEE